MSGIACGHCKGRHASVAEVRYCSQGTLSAATTADASQPEPVEITEGIWKLGDDVYKVQIAVHGSGHPYAKKLTKNIGDEWSFDYAPGAINRLRSGGARKLTADEAAEFGKLYGICISCSKTLTHERSIEVGYGKKCAANNGWPW